MSTNTSNISTPACSLTPEALSIFSELGASVSDTSHSGCHIACVVGAQWGDEGKGKLVGLLAEEADICCRFNGGANAGHTLVVDGVKHALHLLPCGVLSSRGTLNFLGNGVVVHLKTLLKEIEHIKPHVPDVLERACLAPDLPSDLPEKTSAAFLLNVRKDASACAIGTTRRGIGPCYSSKAARIGVRVGDLLLDWPLFKAKYQRLLNDFERMYQLSYTDAAAELEAHRHYREVFRSQIVDGIPWLHDKLLVQKKKVLVEGANACLLDIDFGTYPYVTSSSTVAGGISTGLGIPPALVRNIIGVVKAYTTRVGLGPFPTELHDATGETIRKNGAEFGTTTGRPRRCGWFDAPLVHAPPWESVNIRLFTIAIDLVLEPPELCLSVTHTVSMLSETLKICVAYRNRHTGEALPRLSLPVCLESYDDYEPVYETMSGWSESLGKCKQFTELPYAAQCYVKRLENLIGCRVEWVMCSLSPKKGVFLRVVSCPTAWVIRLV